MSDEEEGEWRIIIHRNNPDGIPTLELKRVSRKKKKEISLRETGVKIFKILFFLYPVVWISGTLAYLLQSEGTYQIYEQAVEEMGGS